MKRRSPEYQLGFTMLHCNMGTVRHRVKHIRPLSRERREVGGAGYPESFEARAQPCPEVALTAGTPNFSTLPRQPRSPARRAGGLQNDGRGPGLAERTLSFARTTPALLALFSLVTLWAHDLVGRGRLGPRCAAWYPKRHLTFSDALGAVRRQLWEDGLFQTSGPSRDMVKIPAPLAQRLLAQRLLDAACFPA